MEKVTYIAENEMGERVEFTLRNPVESRSRAVRQIKEWMGESKSYEGLKLSLLVCLADTLSILPVLTGDRMHTEDILEALKLEYEMLDGLGFKLPAGICELGEDSFRHISDDFIFLYYFTVS